MRFLFLQSQQLRVCMLCVPLSGLLEKLPSLEARHSDVLESFSMFTAMAIWIKVSLSELSGPDRPGFAVLFDELEKSEHRPCAFQ